MASRPKTAPKTARSPKEALLAKRTKRRVERNTTTPGPGTYRPVCFSDVTYRSATGVRYTKPKPGATIGREFFGKTNSNPGPGSYSVLKPFGARTAGPTMRGFCSRENHYLKVNQRSSIKSSPGPCYNPPLNLTSDKPNSIHVVLKGRVRNHFDLHANERSPGPAAYSPGLRKSIPTIPSFRFDRTKRETGPPKHVSRPDEPGPGAYAPMIDPRLGKFGIKGFMSGKPYVNGRPSLTPHTSNVPGPGHYAPKTQLMDGLSQKGGLTAFGIGDRFQEPPSQSFDLPQPPQEVQEAY